MMDFKLQLSRPFKSYLIVISCNLFIAIMRIEDHLSKSEYLHYSYIPTILIISLTVPLYYRHIYAAIFRKPILTVNDIFIYDFIGDVKYYWKDIETFEDTDSSIYINLYHQQNYLNKIGNPFKKFIVRLRFKPESKASSFVININNIYANPDELLKILNDYSIEAENLPGHLRCSNT